MIANQGNYEGVCVSLSAKTKGYIVSDKNKSHCSWNQRCFHIKITESGKDACSKRILSDSKSSMGDGFVYMSAYDIVPMVEKYDGGRFNEPIIRYIMYTGVNGNGVKLNSYQIFRDYDRLMYYKGYNVKNELISSFMK